MKKKKVNQKEDRKVYTCSCGSISFIQEGTASFREEVTISIGGKGMIIEGGDPELDIIDAAVKCTQCGAEVA